MVGGGFVRGSGSTVTSAWLTAISAWSASVTSRITERRSTVSAGTGRAAAACTCRSSTDSTTSRARIEAIPARCAAIRVSSLTGPSVPCAIMSR